MIILLIFVIILDEKCFYVFHSNGTKIWPQSNELLMRYSVLILFTLKFICVLKDLEIRGIGITNCQRYLISQLELPIFQRRFTPRMISFVDFILKLKKNTVTISQITKKKTTSTYCKQMRKNLTETTFCGLSIKLL